jgi:hypothetical protein
MRRESGLGRSAERRQVSGHADNPEQPPVAVDNRNPPRVGQQGQLLPIAGRGVGRDRRAVLRDFGRGTPGIDIAGDVGRRERADIASVVREHRDPPARAVPKPVSHVADRRIRRERGEAPVDDVQDGQARGILEFPGHRRNRSKRRPTIVRSGWIE